MKFLVITNDPILGVTAQRAGVDYIFIDLEINGKRQRQGHTDSFITSHTVEDIISMRSVIRDAKLLVRINPVYSGSVTEINEVLSSGADAIMLPMFREIEELEFVSNQISGRAELWPLIETRAACRNMLNFKKGDIGGITSFFFGLNDLHLELDLNFLFSSLIHQEVRACMEHFEESGIDFGFGGMSTLNTGDLSGKHVVALHNELGSSSVILSRSFTSCVASNDRCFLKELNAIRDFDQQLRKRANNGCELFQEALTQIKKIESSFDRSQC